MPRFEPIQKLLGVAGIGGLAAAGYGIGQLLEDDTIGLLNKKILFFLIKQVLHVQQQDINFRWSYIHVACNGAYEVKCWEREYEFNIDSKIAKCD